MPTDCERPESTSWATCPGGRTSVTSTRRKQDLLDMLVPYFKAGLEEQRVLPVGDLRAS